jgi:hypothetical protein
LALILDNGPTHAPKQLERWLAAEAQARGWPLTINVYWLPNNASWLDQIEIWFSILQRKLLKPNDFESLQALEKAIRSFIRYCNRSAKPIDWTYTVDKLEKNSVHINETVYLVQRKEQSKGESRQDFGYARCPPQSDRRSPSKVADLDVITGLKRPGGEPPEMEITHDKASMVE